MNYAIVNGSIVTNVIEMHPVNANDYPEAVCCDDCPVLIGDLCENGTFYRDGIEVKTITMTRLEEMADMRAALNDLGVFADGQMA